MKTQYRILLEIFIVLMIIIALGYCNKCVSKQTKTNIPITDAKVTAQVYGYIYNKEVDTLNKAKELIPIYKDRWHQVYDTIYKQAPDTCHYYLSKLNAEKNASDSINDLVIKAYGSVIDAGIIYQAKKDSVIKAQDIVLNEKDAIIDSLTHSKKKYFKGFKHGLIVGAIIVEGLNVGSKFIK